MKRCNECSKQYSQMNKNPEGGCTPPVVQINNDPGCVLFHKVVFPASIGDDTTNPPSEFIGKYKNVLLVYEANNHSYMFSSDGVPTFIAGEKGEQGDQGEQGETGPAGTIEIGETTTGEPGTDASVENVGTPENAILNFTIPQGEKGEQGYMNEQDVRDVVDTIIPENFFDGDATDSGCGTDITLNDMIGGQLTSLDIKGDTEQQTYTGKNLLNVGKNCDTQSGASASFDYVTQTLSITKTTATATNRYCGWYVTGVTPGASYAFSMESFTNAAISDTGRSIMIRSHNGSSATTLVTLNKPQLSTTFTAPSDSQRIEVFFYIASENTESTSTIVKPQLEKNTSVTSFEPFVGATFSPNPLYPQPIYTVTGEQHITVNGKDYEINLGKNLFDRQNVNVLNAYFELSQTTIASSANNRTVWIKCMPNTTYTIQRSYVANGRCVGWTDTEPALGVTVYGITETTGSDDIKYATITTGPSAKYLVFRAYQSQQESTYTFGAVLDTIQIEAGSQPTEYSSYFAPIELCKLGDYQDRIYKDGDTWKVYKATGKITLDGSEDWNVVGSGGTGYYYKAVYSGQVYNSAAKSSHYKWYSYLSTGDSVDKQGFAVQNGTTSDFSVRVRYGAEESTSDYANWLSSNNVEVYYIPKNSVETVVTRAELIDQLEAIRLESGSNSISVASAGLVPEVCLGGYIDNWSGNIANIDFDLSQKATIFDTVAQMQAATELGNGQCAITLGYYSANDGGGATYVMSDSGTADGGSVIALSNGLYANLVISDSCIKIDQFGAHGDGVTDDYQYLKKAHDYANLNGYKVVGTAGKTYYVRDFSDPIQIKTDVDWNGSEIIVDDKGATSVSALFEVIYSTPEMTLTDELSVLNKDQATCGLTGHGNIIARIQNSNKLDFIRTGSVANPGSPRTEYMRIDNDGNILDGVYFQFDQVTSVRAYKIDEKEITLENGKFITIGIDKNSSTYYKRGIQITRSNVTIRNITHTVEGETTQGSPYTGFFYFLFAANVKMVDCLVSGRKAPVYNGTTYGSYDINTEGSIDCVFENVKQIESITDMTYWSTHGANYCKNMTFNNCILSKIDAHKGVKNLYINDCIVGTRGIGFCGWGKVVINNTKVYDEIFCYLRNDFGAWFDGDIEINNSTLSYDAEAGGTLYYILAAQDTDISHDYGYKCYLPNLKVNGFKVEGSNSDSALILYKTPSETNSDSIDYSVSYENNTVYPHLFKDYIKAENVTMSPNYKHIYLFSIQDPARVYTEKTGITYDKKIVKKMVDNVCNFNVSLKNIDFSPIMYMDYVAGMCDLWRSTVSMPSIPDGVATHRPVFYFEIENCNNLHIDTVGRPATMKITDCTINQLQLKTDSPNRTFIDCDSCTFDIEHSDMITSGVYDRDFTYNITNSTFNITCADTTLLDHELAFRLFKSKNYSLAVTNTLLNCSLNTTVDLPLYFESRLKYYGLTLEECYNSKYGKIVFRKSGTSDSNRPAPVNGKIETQLGDEIFPVGSTYINTSSPMKLYVFDGTNWTDVLA